MVYCGEPYEINANWRLGCENGYDPGHQFIHNWSEMCINAGMHTSYGYTTKEAVLDTTRYVENEDGPKGFTRKVEKTEFKHEASIPLRDGGRKDLILPLARGKSEEELAQLTDIIRLGTVGLWMPCSLKVTTFPAPQCTHYEFYVPKNKDVHIYFQFGVIHTDDEEEAERWLGEDGSGYVGGPGGGRVLPWMTPLPVNSYTNTTPKKTAGSGNGCFNRTSN